MKQNFISQSLLLLGFITLFNGVNVAYSMNQEEKIQSTLPHPQIQMLFKEQRRLIKKVEGKELLTDKEQELLPTYQKAFQQWYKTLVNRLALASCVLKNIMNALDNSNKYFINYSADIVIKDQSISVSKALESLARAIKNAQKAVERMEKTDSHVSLIKELKNLIRKSTSDIRIFIRYYLERSDEEISHLSVLSILPDIVSEFSSRDLLRRLKSINASIQHIIKTNLKESLPYKGKVRGLTRRAAEVIRNSNHDEEAKEKSYIKKELKTILANLTTLINYSLKQGEQDKAVTSVQRFVSEFTLPEKEK